MKRPSLAFLAAMTLGTIAAIIAGTWLWVHVAEAGGWLRAFVALGLALGAVVATWRSKVAADRYDDDLDALRRIGGGL